ncbi:MAG: IS21 family transposase, partial [Rhodocyclaceae bacterium]|nr:IS21 family transposase [Rhodocyclaceae bacterium]
MGLLAKVRRMHFRDRVGLREIARQTGLARNTLRSWLRRPDVTEPKYPARQTPGVIDPWADTLRQWLST